MASATIAAAINSKCFGRVEVFGNVRVVSIGGSARNLTRLQSLLAA
jgi:hypothetical protein